MANTKRGLVTIMLDKERTLKFDLNTLIDVEDKLGFSLAELEDKVTIKVLRTLLHAGLVHEDPELTEQQVGSFIDFENLAEVQQALVKAMGGSGN